MHHVPRELLPDFIDALHRRLEPDSIVFCASQRWQGSAEEPWYEKPETGDMVSLRHHDDGRPIEVVDTLFTEDIAGRQNTWLAYNLKAMVVVGELHRRARPGLRKSVNTRSDLLIKFGFRAKNRSNANQRSLKRV
jgi:hypothetical protein